MSTATDKAIRYAFGQGAGQRDPEVREALGAALRERGQLPEYARWGAPKAVDALSVAISYLPNSLTDAMAGNAVPNNLPPDVQEYASGQYLHESYEVHRDRVAEAEAQLNAALAESRLGARERFVADNPVVRANAQMTLREWFAGSTPRTVGAIPGCCG